MNSRNLRSDEEGKDPKVKEQMTVMSPAEPWTVELTETVIEDPQGGQDVTVDQGDSWYVHDSDWLMLMLM